MVSLTIDQSLGLKTLVMVIITAGVLDAAPLQDANKVSDESTKKITSILPPTMPTFPTIYSEPGIGFLNQPTTVMQLAMPWNRLSVR